MDQSPLLPQAAFSRSEPVFVIVGRQLGVGTGKATIRVLAGTDPDDILDEVFRYRTNLATYLLIGFALVLLLSLGFSRFITSPLRDLSNAVARQNSTNIKEFRDIPYSYNDEVSDLYEAVRKLSNDLKSTFMRLESNQAILEHTIAERTAMLKDALGELEETKINLELIVSRQASQLVAAERRATIATYVNGLAHNLKNPLANIMGYLSLLRDEMQIAGATSDEWNEYMGIMVEGCEKMREIIDNMLDRASSRESEKRVWIDVNKLIQREMLFMESDLFFKHQLEREMQLAPHLPSFFGSYAGLSQVVENLLRNAREAMQDAPTKKLVVHTRTEDGKLVMEFEDTGCGMSPEVQQRIFEPHFSTKRGKSMIGGSGIGLSFCKLAVESYGGSISVQSEPDKGSVFKVMLPLGTAKTGDRNDEVQ
jgi:signal transduction histidine kinase